MNEKPAFRAELAKLQSYLPPESGRAGKIRLDLNENTSGCSPAVRRALAALSIQEIAAYPEYELTTRELACYFQVRSNELVLTNGADDALRVFFDAFVERGSPVLFCRPSFPMYRYYAELFGAKILSPNYGVKFRFPVDEVLRALRRRPKLAIFANPNNPTGDLLDCSLLKRIVTASPRTAVVIDEAYVEFSGVTALPWIRRYPNLFVVRTFSKAAGLAGLRLGALIGNAHALESLRRAMPPFGVNVAALVAARAAIRDVKSIRKFAYESIQIRDSFAIQLQRRQFSVFPSAGNFVLADFGRTGLRLFRGLERRGILIRPRPDIGPGFARISIGTKDEMSKLLRAIDALTGS